MPNSLRGSEWRRWDLHVHTPKSIVQEYGGDTDEVWESYIAALEALPTDIKVLGINDYIFVDGYEKVLEYKNSGRLQNIDLLLPVIELRVDKLVGSEQLRRINYHVIFSDAIPADTIRSQFIAALSSAAKLDSDIEGVTWSGVLTPDALTDLGQLIYDNTPEGKKPPDSKLHIGFNNVNVSLAKIEGILRTNTYFKDKHLTAIGKNEWDDFRWDGSVSEKKTLINSVDLVLTASPEAQGAVNHVSSLVANGVNCKVVHSCDGHQFTIDPSNTKPKELGHCFTWIKADTTFDGLRQVIYDYEDRVRLQLRNPYEDDVKYVLNNITIKEGGTLKPQVLPINRDLVSIIGSKGSGKSLLLSAISSISDLSDYGKHRHDIFGDDDKTQLIDFDLEDKAGVSQEKHGIELSIEDEAYYTEPVLYIAQEELASRSKQPHKVRKEYLRELGINDLSIGYHDVTDDTQYSLKQIDDLTGDLVKITHEFDQTTVGAMVIKEFLEKRIKGLEATNKKLTNDETRHVIGELSAIIAQGQETTLWQKNDGFQEIRLLAQDINERISQYNTKATAQGATEENSLPLVDVEKLNAAHEKSSAAVNAVLKTKRDIYAEKKQELEKLGVSEDIPTLLKTVENIQRDIAAHKKALEDVEKINEALPKRRSHISGLFAADATIYQRIAVRASEIDTKFSEFKNDRSSSPIFEKLFAHINVEANIFFDYKKLETDIVECFYKGRLTIADLHTCIFGEDKPTHESYFKWINSSFWEFFDGHSKDFKDRTTSGQSGLERLRQVILLDWYEYVSVSVNITHTFSGEDKEIHAMSTGELATVLLKLILVTQGLDKQIILLDQPEDHLDNEFIANDLVDLIRALKKMRQVIIVTHNANLVVMTDSEQVIVAKGIQGEYLSGGIEHPDIKDSIVTILEGGSEAFKKRHKRYGNS